MPEMRREILAEKSAEKEIKQIPDRVICRGILCERVDKLGKIYYNDKNNVFLGEI